MYKTLIVTGIMLLLTGLLWPWLSQCEWGRLPGDIFIEKGSLKLYIPMTTSLLISLLVRIFFWLEQLL